MNARLNGPATLHDLAQRCRVRLSFVDNDGTTQRAPDDTLRHIIAAMGYACGNDGEVDTSYRRIVDEHLDTLADPVVLVPQGSTTVTIELRVPAGLAAIDYDWKLVEEDGTRSDGRSTLSMAADNPDGETHRTVPVTIDLALPLGYHDMELTAAHGQWSRTVRIRLIVSPPKCFIPDQLRSGKKKGVVLGVQLNSIRSRTNWGTGDFLDVEAIAADVAPLGVDAIGLSPLHPPQPDGFGNFSPYLGCSRGITDPVRINVRRAAERLGASNLLGELADGEFTRHLEQLRSSRIVHKLSGKTIFGALERLWEEFKVHHSNPATDEWTDLQEFIVRRGRRLRLYATFAAIREELIVADRANGSFRNWPVELRDPHSAEVEAFASAHADRIMFYQFVEWIARHDVREMQRRCKALGMLIGPYFDLAMSADGGGAENWMDPDLVVPQVTIGFPPDALGPQGQNIGSPPMNPFRVRLKFYEQFIELLRYNMEGGGAIRIDHFPQVMQLLWIPVGKNPADGAYVLSFMEELLAILCLESHRAQCMVIGEDLGTVPDEVRKAMKERDILSYRVQRFERKWSEPGQPHVPPAEYPEEAIAVVTTHDLALKKANWSRSDVVLRESLALDPPEKLEGFLTARAVEMADLVSLLDSEGLLTAAPDVILAQPTLPHCVLVGAHGLLKRTPCMLIGVELGDANGLEDPYNVPGTGEETRPNWRTLQPILRENYLTDGHLKAILAAMCN